MVCPYLRGGLCTSPALGTPTDYVVDNVRCVHSYQTCRYYVATVQGKAADSDDVSIRIYTPVNILSDAELSDCPNYRLIRTSKGIVAKCAVIGRVLTKSQVMLCTRHSSSCPFRSLTNEAAR